MNALKIRLQMFYYRHKKVTDFKPHVKKSKRSFWGNVILGLFLIALACLFFFPVLYMISQSLKPVSYTHLVMIKLIKQPNDVAKYLSNFSDSLSALADWVTGINNLPLELDYLAVCGEGYKLPKANGNFFENFAHTWNSFIGSFTNDFKVHMTENETDRKQLDVWVTVDTRTEYDIIQKLINAAYADSEDVYKRQLQYIVIGKTIPDCHQHRVYYKYNK